MRRRVGLPILLLALAAGCARQPAPVVTPGRPEPPAGLGALRVDLAAGFGSPSFANAVWGVTVRSLKTGETFFERNPRTFLMPASNMKVITAAVAAERLGWAHTFDTRLVAEGPIEHGILKGDLVIEGSGDPSLAGRPGPGVSVVDAWADSLANAGITVIDGRIVGDDDAFTDEGLGQGWAWDYLAYGYATPAGALAFNENVVQLTFRPGAGPGDPASLDVSPDVGGLVVEHTVKTGENDSRVDLDLRRLPGAGVLRITGTIPANRQEVRQTVSVDNPTLFLAGALRRALVARGIRVSGDVADIDDLPRPQGSDAESRSAGRTATAALLTYSSPTLAELVKVMLKVSQNLYADTLLRTLGRTAGEGVTAGSAAGGRTAVRETLQGWGIEPERYVLADGSGLSRYNYLSADVLVSVLTRMYSDERHRLAFLDALPIAGVDGTIAGRMKGTRAEGNAHAKTGSIANARALSGFVTTADGEPLVFSMIVNNFNVPQAEADAVIDRAVARLAAFHRR